VYDNTKLKNNTIKLAVYSNMINPIYLSEMSKGLYNLRIETPSYNTTDYLFYWDEASDFSIPVFIETADEHELINCFINIYVDGIDVRFDVCNSVFDNVLIDNSHNIILTRIL
jgi:hypothetical protein